MGLRSIGIKFLITVNFLYAPLFAAELPVKKIRIGKKVIQVEVASNIDQMRQGLMFRESLGKNKGMLFVYPKEQPLSFWMKNTFIPLSIGFFNKNKEFIHSLEMKASKSEMEQNLTSYSSNKPAKYALEMNKSWFIKNKVKPGQKFSFIKENN